MQRNIIFLFTIDKIAVEQNVFEEETGTIVEKAWDAKAEIRRLESDYVQLIDEIPCLKDVNFSPLIYEPRVDYTTQISTPIVWINMLGAAFIYYEDLGIIARYLDGGYLGEWRDKDTIVSAVKSHIYVKDCDHITRIFDL